MGPSNSVAAVLLFFSAISAVSAFNITNILQQYPDYSQFNDLLTTTGLAADVNKRSTITILAIPNSAIGGLASKPVDDQMRILSTHIILDYYDRAKLSGIKGNSTMLTTLLQTTGAAKGRQGFVRIAHPASGGTAFASAVKNSPLDAKYEGPVMSRPFNVSILRVSQPIQVNGIDGTWATAPAEAVVADAEAPPPAKEAAAPSPDEVVADAPAEDSTPTPAPSVADAPTAAAPSSEAADVAADESSAAVTRVAYGVAVAAPLVLAMF